MISVKKISKNEVVLEFAKNVSPEQAEKVFKNILNSSFQKITVDCFRLLHLGHQLLGKLYMFNMDLRIGRRELILIGCSDEICRLLHITKIDERIKIAKEPFQTRPQNSR